MEIIRTENLGKTYYKGKLAIPALSGLDVSVRKGEFFSIIGKSGSGKSTLLNLLGGLDQPTHGRLFVEGKDLANLSRNELARHRCHTVGMIFQSFNLIPSRSALENITLALAFGRMPRNRRKKTALELLDRVGLAHRAHHLPDELSGGESQRAAIARALANRPRLLLADEPTGNLDSQTASEITSLLKTLNRETGLTVLMVTHDRETAGRLSDRIIVLKDGQLSEQIENKGT